MTLRFAYLAVLRMFPHGWQIWTVLKAIGGTIWCARRWDGIGQVLNAASADELAEYLEEASSR